LKWLENNLGEMTMKRWLRQRSNNGQEWAFAMKEAKDLTRTIELGNKLVNKV
jgi:hypothetical protein